MSEEFIEKLMRSNLGEDTFRSTLGCLIPSTVIPQHVVQKIIEGIFDMRLNEQQNRGKIEALLEWLGSLLESGLIHKSIDNFYHLFFHMLPSHVKPISNILYHLTKADDVNSRNIEKMRELMHTNEGCSEACLLTRLLNRFKELNAEAFRDSSSAGYYVHNIKNAADLGKHIQRRDLIIPSFTLSLMKSDVGIYILMFSEKSLRESFFTNLSSILKKNVITHPDSVSLREKENLLQNVITLHFSFQQGFVEVSKFLSALLQSWDGVTLKHEVLALAEWFVFKLEAELHEDLLKPLYSLFVVGNGEVDLMCDILTCLTNFSTNLFFMIRNGDKIIYKEDILRTRDQLEPVLKSLTKYFAHLCDHGLYQFPCNARILKNGIDFYLKINQLDENLHKFPSSLLYHSLLSSNAQLLEEVCALMSCYREKIFNKVVGATEDTVHQLALNAQNMYNCLWRSTAFTGPRSTLNPNHEQLVIELIQEIDAGLDLEKHIMFEPFRCHFRAATGSKEEILSLISQRFPYIEEFIATVNNMVQSGV